MAWLCAAVIGIEAGHVLADDGRAAPARVVSAAPTKDETPVTMSTQPWQPRHWALLRALTVSIAKTPPATISDDAVPAPSPPKVRMSAPIDYHFEIR